MTVVTTDSGVAMTDKGWFPLHFTNPSSSSDLAMPKKQINNDTSENLPLREELSG